MVQEHIKTLTKLFNELAVVGDMIKEEDRVVYLLASLPDSFNTLVTALEANKDISKMIRREKDLTAEWAMTTTKARGLKCFNCKKFSETLSRTQQVREEVEQQDKVEGRQG